MIGQTIETLPAHLPSGRFDVHVLWLDMPDVSLDRLPWFAADARADTSQRRVATWVHIVRRRVAICADRAP